MRATCSAHLILDLITLIVLGEWYRLWSSLYNFLHPAATSSLSHRNTNVHTSFLDTFIISHC